MCRSSFLAQSRKSGFDLYVKEIGPFFRVGELSLGKSYVRKGLRCPPPKSDSRKRNFWSVIIFPVKNLPSMQSLAVGQAKFIEKDLFDYRCGDWQTAFTLRGEET